MTAVSKTVKSADWKTEKHAPVIEAPASVEAGVEFKVKVSLGKGVAHPNTTEHHISWISVYFLPEGAPVPLQVGRFEFTGHGESAAGPNQGPLYTTPSAAFKIKTDKPGTLQAVSFCNIHGLWESTAEIALA